MMKFIKSDSDQVLIKHNSDTCEVMEYIFSQPKLGIARSIINGRYPDLENKKVVNNKCDIIYFVLNGIGTIHTENNVIDMKKNDALFLTSGEWYWVEGKEFEILIISNPEWTVDQYQEF